MTQLPDHYDKSKMGILPGWIDEKTGRLRSLREMQEPQQRAAHAAQIASAVARQNADAAKGETQKRLEAAEKAYADAKFQADRPRMAMWKDHIETLTGKLEGEAATAAKAAAFDAHPQVKLIRQTVSVDSLMHLFPASDRTGVETLHAISQSNEYPTPESLVADYQYHWDQLHSHNLAVEQQRANELGLAAAKADVEHAHAQVRLAELAQAKVPNAE
jgi:hypothetical protein